MNALIVLSHPNPESFGRAIHDAVQQTLLAAGHAVRTCDLYASPLKLALDGADFEAMQAGGVPSDVQAEQELIAWADLMVFVYPVWWYDRPAALKGWIDRVWTPGFAYRYESSRPVGLLAGKTALVFQTTGAPREAYADHGEEDAIVVPMRDGTLRFCGLDVPAFTTLHAVPYVPADVRAAMLQQVRETVAAVAGPASPSAA